ncbi:alkaline phosphatase D family protein [Novosphingobium sp.]|uniref:alkaline phosphatase D family protein n=1 Tax=Novosphingobium sp. TaxID=1874826 RepID=UPI0022BCBF4A|nr:alkaline phosphatase D family protein [Novosphingobium sp.]MCZ8019071.1 alkaline phosphatase D family protein [Novosphingobium sp.]MCZ8034879.1 alkaline phosphatase D family protein [Novosphingobium sp.]MCZ8052447.1 alkaline phosphatase D family protein [Novosphingobium sp.]MCZ8058546.1 alkaline phosphatase D family protein [Novosphingobium sp.]MCZ8232943.1 alkaline phosphatase D family protein [Novosphingobium sp.]
MLPAPPDAPLLAANRRQALRLGLLGLAGIGAPALAAGGKGFTHCVASGEPGPTQVLLWTRYASDNEVKLAWELAESADFSQIVAQGETTASPANDCCARAWAKGLQPGRWYFYRFIAPDGEKSPVGRTKTLPVGKVDRFRIAVFSCSNYGFGWFNAYGHAAEAGDFDLVLHLGDYFYEYERGNYPSAREGLPERLLPDHETVTMAQYRERFSTYRNDPDLQRLHQLYPVIAMWDDHEVANDTWKDGAENHQPDKEGPYAVREAVAEKVYREWLPVSDAYWAQYEIGKLATLFRLETRHIARDKPFDLGDLMKGKRGPELEAALTAFRDDAWQAPERTLLGAEQEAWLASGLKASTRSGKPWQVLAQQIIMGQFGFARTVVEGMTQDVDKGMRARILAADRVQQSGIPYAMDMWSGYPAARQRLYRAALEANANLLVLAGDSHNAWAFDHSHAGQRVGVEMAGQSVTSPGFEHYLRWVKPADLAAGVMAASPALKWCDTSQRGYLAVELTPKAATGEWRFLQTVRQKGTALAGTRRMTVLAGQKRFSA